MDSFLGFFMLKFSLELSVVHIHIDLIFTVASIIFHASEIYKWIRYQCGSTWFLLAQLLIRFCE